MIFWIVHGSDLCDLDIGVEDPLIRFDADRAEDHVFKNRSMLLLIAIAFHVIRSRVP